jgi:hypothetical protein
MEEVLHWFSNHPLVAVILAAIGIVVTIYFVRKHFLRIILVIILTLVGYLMYLNGFFTKESFDKVKSVSFTEVESTAEKGLKDGFVSVKAISPEKIENKADAMRVETRKEMMPHLTEDTSAAAAAAPVGQKNAIVPAAGGKTAVSHQPAKKKEIHTKTDQAKKKKTAKPKGEEDGN